MTIKIKKTYRNTIEIDSEVIRSWNFVLLQLFDSYFHLLKHSGSHEHSILIIRHQRGEVRSYLLGGRFSILIIFYEQIFIEGGKLYFNVFVGFQPGTLCALEMCDAIVHAMLNSGAMEERGVVLALL